MHTTLCKHGAAIMCWKSTWKSACTSLHGPQDRHNHIIIIDSCILYCILALGIKVHVLTSMGIYIKKLDLEALKGAHIKAIFCMGKLHDDNSLQAHCIPINFPLH